MSTKPSHEIVLKRSITLFSTIVLIILITIIYKLGLTMIKMPGVSYVAPLPPLSKEEMAYRVALKQEVEKLSGEIGERNVVKHENLTAAADNIESSFKEMGYEVQKQGYEISGKTCYNIEVEIPGKEKANEIVIIGGHYDSVIGYPGANDNATGVAALLALARSFVNKKLSKILRFVAFANEEPPFFKSSQMGSLVYAKRCRARGDKIVAMFSLETIGYYSDETGSQRYPFPVGLFYPSTGNFIAFVGNFSSRGLVREVVNSFRNQVKFPSEGAALPGFTPGIGWSDHWAFWQMRYPAIMVTDTAPFRYPFYHTVQDTPDKIHYEHLTRVVVGLKLVVADLVGVVE